jgi:hypothetical protein
MPLGGGSLIGSPGGIALGEQLGGVNPPPPPPPGHVLQTYTTMVKLAEPVQSHHSPSWPCVPLVPNPPLPPKMPPPRSERSFDRAEAAGRQLPPDPPDPVAKVVISGSTIRYRSFKATCLVPSRGTRLTVTNRKVHLGVFFEPGPP